MATLSEPTRNPLAGPVVYLFGPLALSFDATHLSTLRKLITANPTHHQWVLSTIKQLPHLHATITASIPTLESTAPTHQAALLDLVSSFQTGTQLETPAPLPNTLLIPLVVASHLVQYAEFLAATSVEVDERVDVFAGSKVGKETLGLCTGLLSAFAVASAKNGGDFEKYGAVAMRLGMLVGMAVDAQNFAPEVKASKSLATAWTSGQAKEELLGILAEFPEAYLSVDYDENRATVTSAAATIQTLHQRLRAAGITSSEIGLHGRFHSDCHNHILDSLVKLCDANTDFQFVDASAVAIPTRSNNRGTLLTTGPLHRHALTSILAQVPQWHQTFTTLRESTLSSTDASIISFGSERCVPPSHMISLSQQVTHLSDATTTSASSTSIPATISENDIAVIGMSCKVAGANNLSEFWDLLCAGESQHREVPSSRIKFEAAFREVTDPKRKWFANMVEGPDRFDHKFFKKSPRESATMDPQQRLLLQVAYQAVEQSGYFHTAEPDKRIGCYVGLCSTDYEHNISCHQPNAFSATGNLQGFVAGKVSHHFGWTGPGLTIDTACSSSAVAVHSACRAIISGECVTALAGGTHVMTSPLWFQNLAGASFLSTTGQCKPFDAKADGYCRGEGVGAVFLKKLSAAVADGDQILGVVAATAVQQNQNCTPIFVPNSPSLSDLFRVVTKEAGLKPGQVSVIEAHGTGTSVGDPAEYDSIRQVFGGPIRSKPLVVSSVKGLVGHLECTSGIISMIKVLLMMNKGLVPPQASFTSLNPALKAVPEDRMSVPTGLVPWDTDFRAALVNNYGASGSNASMILTQSPLRRVKAIAAPETKSGLKYPVWLSGFDEHSLKRSAKAINSFISTQRARGSDDLSIANVVFNLARQSNRSLDRSLTFHVQSIDELQQKLTSYTQGSASVSSDARPVEKPVVLCFGGQISTFVGLDRHVYNSIAVLRKHLDRVDAVAKSLGVGSIFPAIFERSPIKDIVKLQTVLFANQYACARSWLDAGLKPQAVVGHSFGELTSLCITQVLSLEDTLKMIVGRATLIQESWGAEKGAMMAVEAELADVERLIVESNKLSAENGTEPVSIACYNGPKSFTLAGPDASIDKVTDAMNKMPNTTPIRAKKLNVTNAFHCALVDPLMEKLEQGAEVLTFRAPKIAIERATEVAEPNTFSPKFVAQHMRQPVFFNHAVQRLAKQYPNAVFLEAGSSSTITNMASRALGNPAGSTFQAINITNDNGWNNLGDATVNLWKAGLPVHFWGHQGSQTQAGGHTPLMLPPYQFDQSSHWLEVKSPSKIVQVIEPAKAEPEKLPETLTTFLGFQDSNKRLAKFRINTIIPLYEKFVVGHIIAETAAICPSIVQLDLVIEAAQSILPPAAGKLVPQIQMVENQAPLCVNPARQVYIELDEQTHSPNQSWIFRVLSNEGPNDAGRTIHTTGTINFASAGDHALKLEFSRLERLMGHKRYTEMMSSPDVDEILAHKNIYRIFSEIVEYSDEYRGLQKLVGQGNQSAGFVTKQSDAATGVDDAFLTESICQVGGIWVNCMMGREPEDMYLANGIERWMRSEKARREDGKSQVLHVLANHHRPSDKAVLTDLFVYDAESGELVEAILGVSFVRVAKNSMRKLLARLSPNVVIAKATTRVEVVTPPSSVGSDPDVGFKQTLELSRPAPMTRAISAPAPVAEMKPAAPKVDVVPQVKAILADLSGLEIEEIKDDSGLADLGIDSLLGMEMAHEIEKAFKITLPESDLMEIIDIPGLMACVYKNVTGEDPAAASMTESMSSDESDGGDGRSVSSADFPTAATTPWEEKEIDFGDLKLSYETVMEAFGETKALTDARIAEYGQTEYVDKVMPVQTEMCVALTLEAFEELGVPLRTAAPGQKFPRISHPAEHRRLVDYLYAMVENESQIITVDEESITRTAVPYPAKSGKDVLQDLLARFPDQDTANKLTFYTGSKLADVLRGTTDGIKLIFGTPEGRELVSGLYGEWPLNRVFYRQMEDFLERLGNKIRGHSTGPLKILEMGAGTGGTTRWIVPLLASLDIPIEYTFTDLAPSFVALARKKFKVHPFMKFRTHDIEKAPADDLISSQHIVIASNAVHATHNLCESTANMRKLLRPDGLLMMLEMTGTIYWVDMIFGLFEGWWFFDDGRTHAVTGEQRWKKDLQSVGYGRVDWTDGERKENRCEKLIMAMASDQGQSRCDSIDAAVDVDGSEADTPRLDTSSPDFVCERSADVVARQTVIDSYVRRFTEGWTINNPSTTSSMESRIEKSASSGRVEKGVSFEGEEDKVVVVTGATGSLGSHVIADLVIRDDIIKVVCLNRKQNKVDGRERQLSSLTKKGITLSEDLLAKIQVYETDMAKPNLGLSQQEYDNLVRSTTHIIHNAWLMNAKWPLKRFEPQLQMMRNLLDLASASSVYQSLTGSSSNRKITFQFISSIATVGHRPLWSSNPIVPETRMTTDSVLPTGYGDAKYICELMLDETLHQHPDRFRAMTVRPGQVAGSSRSGYWNTMEHLSFLIKSSQTLGVLPALKGPMSWTPVDTVANTLIDLLTLQQGTVPYPVYHIENPIRQLWQTTLPVLASTLNIPSNGLLPLPEWVQRVKEWSAVHGGRAEGAEGDNPAILLIDFLEDNFVRMSCGGLLLATEKTREHSRTLRECGPVTDEVVRLFVRSWQDMGFLKA